MALSEEEMKAKTVATWAERIHLNVDLVKEGFVEGKFEQAMTAAYELNEYCADNAGFIINMFRAIFGYQETLVKSLEVMARGDAAMQEHNEEMERRGFHAWGQDEIDAFVAESNAAEDRSE